MNSEPRFRPLTEADLPAVVPIEAASHAHPWSAAQFAGSLAAGHDAWLGEDGKGGCLGYYLLLPAVDEVELLNITVAPGQRRRGLGRKLLSHAEGRALELGGNAMLLEVRVSNEPAIALYRSAGFSDLALRRGYYPTAEGREDALIMKKALAC